jgi:hypothetical protein
MAKPYFRQVPDLDYVSRLPDSKISDYIRVKNLFRKGKIRDDIFENLSYFTKYEIEGNERPDEVAYKFYDDSTLDWIILLSNNILNIQTEWPMDQQSFDTYLLKKYGDYETLYGGIRHYETTEVVNNDSVRIVPAGLIVPEDYSVTFYDGDLQRYVIAQGITVPVTNYEYEEKLDNKKRGIYILKPNYIYLVFDDMENIMEYKKDSSQYMTGTLKRADNIKIYT